MRWITEFFNLLLKIVNDYTAFVENSYEIIIILILLLLSLTSPLLSLFFFF